MLLARARVGLIKSYERNRALAVRSLQGVQSIRAAIKMICEFLRHLPCSERVREHKVADYNNTQQDVCVETLEHSSDLFQACPPGCIFDQLALVSERAVRGKLMSLQPTSHCCTRCF